MRWMMVAGLLVLGCDSSEEVAGICGVSPPSAAGDRSAYPAGANGTTECSVIADLKFANSDGTEYGLGDDVYSAGKKLLLISTTAGWCAACQEEQPVLEEWYQGYKGRGLAVMVAYFEDSNFNPSTADLAAGWKDRFNLSFPVVSDSGPFQLGEFYDQSLTPMNMFVDVETMTILSITTGFDRELAEATLEAWL